MYELVLLGFILHEFQALTLWVAETERELSQNLKIVTAGHSLTS